MEKLNYHKNDIMDECVKRYLKSFAVTLDAVEYVPKPYLKKILKYIFKNMRRHFRKVDGADRQYQRKLFKELKSDLKKTQKEKIKSNLEQPSNIEPVVKLPQTESTNGITLMP